MTSPNNTATSPIVAVVGPTAVGKTALAEELAVRLGGEIVSADSMQVYRRMDIGTAKPAPGERRVPYHCIDLVEPGEPYSAALYQRDARSAIRDVHERGATPVVVGGTGLYLRAALDQMDFPSGEQVGNPARERYERIAEEDGAEALHALLADRDPESAQLLHANNVRRVVRALEMADEGVSYARQASGFAARRSHYDDVRWLGLTMDRERLYDRVNQRVDAMVAAGLLAEVERLLAEGLRDALTASQAIGYKEFVPVIEQGASLDDAVAEVKQSSRRYAKRQLTWFRADPRVRWLDVTELSLSGAADAAVELLESGEPSGESEKPADLPEGAG